MNSIASIISTHRKARKWTLMDLCQRLNERGIDIKHKAISAWESGVSYPPLPAFFTLCEIFEIQDIYEELWGTNPYNPLSELNASGKEKVMEYISLLLKDEQYRKLTTQSSPITDITGSSGFIRLYDMPVSAGSGNFLEESTYEEICPDGSVPAGSSFGVRISGDSMLPHYEDGQIVWVKSQSTLNNGEIGIFLLNGNAYCKKFRNTNKGTALISLNKKYAPMSVTDPEAFRILGKVLS